MNPIRKFITFIICFFILSISIVSLASDIESLEIGDLINFGEFHSEPILWQIVDFDDHGNPLLLSKEIIDLKPFDAAGRKHSPDGYYNWAQYYGSNQWETSTLRQWLNSTRKNINWQLNPPSDENVFEGINAYADEPGFLYRQNFPFDKRNMILKTDSGDRVFLLSHDEYKDYYSNLDFFPLFTPTRGALERSDYIPRGIKSALVYDILTRDAIMESPHGVKAFKAPDSIVTSVANFGDKGVAPAIYLDIDKIVSGEITGEGTSLNPYEISEGFSLNILIAIAAILLVIIILVVMIRKRKASIMILLIGISLFTACQQDIEENHLEDYDEPKVIVLSYANKLDVVLKRLEDFSHNEDSEFIIIDNKGLDQSKWARDYYEWSSKEDELKEIQDDLYKKGYYIVKGGDFRVTSMKAEIDSVFQEIGLVVTNRATTEDPRSKFLEDMKPLYVEGDYNGIIKYLEEKQYTIIHPYDFYSHGISIINSELDH